MFVLNDISIMVILCRFLADMRGYVWFRQMGIRLDASSACLVSSPRRLKAKLTGIFIFIHWILLVVIFVLLYIKT